MSTTGYYAKTQITVWSAILKTRCAMENRRCLVRYLARANEIEEKHYNTLPDNDAKSLLMALTVAHQNRAPLNVSQAMQMRRIGSPAKNHRKINDLLDAGMIELAYDAGNRRTKFLIPTPAAMAIFDALALALAQACNLK